MRDFVNVLCFASTDSSRRFRTNVAEWFVTLVLVAIHLACIVWQINTNFPTRNEVAHVPAGVAYWRTGNFSLYSVNPPLSRLIQAAPLLAVGIASEDTERFALSRDGRFEWKAAKAFASENRKRYFDVMRVARVPGLFWSILGLLIARQWAGEQYGKTARIVVTALWCTDPNILAYAAIATPDLPCAVMWLGSCYLFKRHLAKRSFVTLSECAICLGLAQLTKFSALALYPAFMVIFLRRSTGVRSAAKHGLDFCLMVLVSVIVINLGYGWERSFVRFGDFRFVSQSARKQSERAQVSSSIGWKVVRHTPVPLPENYLLGLDRQQRDFEYRKESYLRGQSQVGGWWYFYLYAALVKLPVGTLLLLALAGCLLRGRGHDILLLPLALLFLISSLKTGYTMHFRYVLPAIPLLLVYVSGVVERTDWIGRAGFVLTVYAGVSSLMVAPHFLSYFNELAGGPRGGAYHLIDSNIDCGQDLLRLRAWVSEHQGPAPLYYCYQNYIPDDMLGVEGAVKVSPRSVPGLRGTVLMDIDCVYRSGPEELRELKPVGFIGTTIGIYEIE